MAPLLPLEVLQTLKGDCACRERQVQQLATYYTGLYPSPPILLAYGIPQTGKVRTISLVLKARDIPHVVVKGRECLSQRHLLSRIFAGCVHKLDQEDEVGTYDKVESLNALQENLQKLFRRKNAANKLNVGFVLVLDGVDRQRGATPTLLPLLARLGDMIRSLSVIITSTNSRALHIHRDGVPSVHFPPYTRADAVTLVTASQFNLIPEEVLYYSGAQDQEAVQAIYHQFITTVYDSLAGPALSLSIEKFRRVCEALWPRFIWPLLSHESPPGKAKSWDFARLLVRNRSLFQTEGEASLVDSLTGQASAVTFSTLLKEHPNYTSRLSPIIDTAQSIENSTSTTKASRVPMLKHFLTLLLLASYLASHTHVKHDQVLFSRLSHTSKKASRVRKTPSTPRKKLFTSNSTTAQTPLGKSASKASKSLFDVKQGIPRPFTLERLIAIVRAVHPSGVARERGIADRAYEGLAQLERLRLVVRVSAAGKDEGEEGEGRWRVNVPREWVVKVLGDWGMGLAGYELDEV